MKQVLTGLLSSSLRRGMALGLLAIRPASIALLSTQSGQSEDEVILARVSNHINFLRGETKSRPIAELLRATGTNKERMMELLNGSQRFSISNGDHVSLISGTQESERPFRRYLANDFRSFLSHLSKLRAEEYPVKKVELRELVTRVMGAEARFDVLLAESLHYGFVALDRTNQLCWDLSLVREVAGDEEPSLVGTTSDSVSERERSVISGRTSVDHSSSDKSPLHQSKTLVGLSQTKGNKLLSLPGGTTCIYIYTKEGLQEVIDSHRDMFEEQDLCSNVVVDCEGIPYSLELCQIAYASGVLVFDAQLIGVEHVCHALEPLLSSESTLKIFHDLRGDAFAFSHFGNIQLRNVLDSQLVNEHLFGTCFGGTNEFIRNMGFEPHETKSSVQRQMNSLPPGQYWKTRPLTKDKLEYAAMDVHCLFQATRTLDENVQSDKLLLLKEASLARAQSAIANPRIRKIGFEISKNYKMSSAELLSLESPTDGIFCSIPTVESAVDNVLGRLPDRFKAKFKQVSLDSSIEELDLSGLTDIVLDQDRSPECWVHGRRVFLCQDSDTTVTKDDIDYIVSHLGEIGGVNRAGLEGQLDRYSVIRARNNAIVGLTIRIGRNVTGVLDILLDYVLGSDKSILLLGEPGSGKTTIVREAARLLSEQKHVIVVDTSNEIGGHGIKPHNCIGLARRMMVHSLDAQSKVMIECVQNHTPCCMIIDEIGRRREVLASRTVRQRGVRMIASAHGDLRKLVKNPELNGLVGGVKQVTLGDSLAVREAAREDPDGRRSYSKVREERATDPTFDVVVELRRGVLDEWLLVPDVAIAVDNILDGREYKVERRSRSPETGEIVVELKRV